MHLHTLKIAYDGEDSRLSCTGCDVKLRLATYDEAVFVQMTDGYMDNGPLLWNNGVVVVPLDFSLYKE